MALSNAQLIELQAELLAGHPDTGAYSADSGLAQKQLHAINRPGKVDSSSVLQYLLLERYFTNTGTDASTMFIYGRLVIASRASVDDFVFGSTFQIKQNHIAACNTLLRVLSADSGFNMDLADSRFDALLNMTKNAKVFSTSDKIAIQTLSAGKQSRAMELSLGFPRAGDIETARGL